MDKIGLQDRGRESDQRWRADRFSFTTRMSFDDRLVPIPLISPVDLDMDTPCCNDKSNPALDLIVGQQFYAFRPVDSVIT